MASPFQQQARRRKLIYAGLILVLFTAAFLWRTVAVAGQAQKLALREVDRGDVKLTDSAIRLSLTGSRGLATCVLWISALDKQKKNQWNELELLVRQVIKLQPHFITPWLFQSWNLAYNVSVESDRVRDKYFYVSRGVNLLAEGERQNRNNPDLRYWTGFYIQHKICKSDETNVQRSLFQLSLIPPNERDPARFKQINPATNLEEVNYAELQDFCKKHPQLVRRLREGIMRDTRGEGLRQFTCPTARDVVQFLADNFRLPAPFEDRPPTPVGLWQKRDDDKLLPPHERFPPLPPARNPEPPQRLYDPNDLTAEQVAQLADDVDAYKVTKAWFGYAQEPIPDPDDMPGETKPITDRVHQRKPKQIATIIFRNQPSLAQSGVAERLQQEGWYDGEAWEIKGWFLNNRFVERRDGRDVRGPAEVSIDPGKASLVAWSDAHAMWRRYGEDNHLLFRSAADELNKKQVATAFHVKYQIGDRAPDMRTEGMDDEDVQGYNSSRFLYEYSANRNMTNFPHHYNHSLVEAREDTVAGRKGFYKAERSRWQGENDTALKTYAATLPFWRDKVLLTNDEYRHDEFTQEESFDWQYRYLRLFDEVNGKALRARINQMTVAVPLLPKVDLESFPAWIVPGPLDGLDKDGWPIVSEDARKTVLGRKPAAVPAQQAPAPQKSQPGAAPQPAGKN